MALPLAIYSGDAMPMGPAFKAPNGSIYVVCFVNGSSVRVYKCSDPDTGSFSEQDSSNRPSPSYNNGVSWVHACQYEHLLFLALGVLAVSEHNIVLKQFNTATDSWVSGTQTIYAGGEGEIPAAWYPSALVATPNYLYCVHPSDSEKVSGTKYLRCMVSYRDLGGTTWNNSVHLVDGEKKDYVPAGIGVTQGEYALVAYNDATANQTSAAIWNRSTFGTAQTGYGLAVISQLVSYMDGSTNRIIIVGHLSSSFGYIARRLTASGTTLTLVGNTLIVGSTGLGQGSRGGVCRWGTTLYAWFNNNSQNPAYSDSTDHGANWTSATQHSDPSNNLTEHPWANAYTRKGQLKIGIVYKEGTTQLSYDERSITNATAPGFASARTPVRQNKILVAT